MSNRTLLTVEVDGEVLVSSGLTPGFFCSGPTQNDASGKYLRVLRQFGPMPMVAPPRAATPHAAPSGNTLRTMYVGFPFDANFGDRWMYQAFQRRLPELQFFHAQTLDDLWMRALPREHFELTMLGGGTLINQKPQLFQEVATSVAAGVPCVCFGTGVGEPARWGDHLGPWAELLRRFAYAGVRGPLSAALLRGGGCEVQVVGDPCLLDLPSFPPERAPGTPLNVWVDVSFGGLENAQTLGFRHRLLGRLRELEQAKRICLSFFTSWDIYLPWQRELISLSLGSPREVVVLKEDNRAVLQEADLCLAYRLHAFAAATMQGRPTIVVNYESKCADFAAFLGLEDWLVEPDDAGAVRLAQILSDDLRERSQQRIATVRAAVTEGKLRTETCFAQFRGALPSPVGTRSSSSSPSR